MDENIFYYLSYHEILSANMSNFPFHAECFDVPNVYPVNLLNSLF